MYVLLYLDNEHCPAYAQASTVELLNQQIRVLWEQEDINRDCWEHGAYQVLGIEDGSITSINHWDCHMVPQIEVM